MRHRGHIKFNAEPNCTLVFVESGCLFVCGGDDLLNERGRDLELTAALLGSAFTAMS